MSELIVAIDLGTSHITGIVGKKKADGGASIIAYETVETDNCIRRGIIYNIDKTTTQVGILLSKLEMHLNGDYIDKVYVGIGGQSLRTIDHDEEMDFAEGAKVTEQDIADLDARCENFKPNLLDVLGIAPPVYSIDGRKDTKAEGVFCKHLVAHYKLVVGRAMIRNNIKRSIEAIPEKALAGILVAPLALADAILTSKDKELGCALIDFGAGVTSVSIYKNSYLHHLCVIPLGGHLITRDLVSLQLTENDAEYLKKEKGSAILHLEDENESIKVEMEETNREVKLSDLNAIIEGRAKEIVENIYARICEVIELRQLGAGIVLAGYAAELADLPELLKEKCGVKIRFSPIQKGLVDSSDEMLGNPLYMMAISLMLKGTESCVSAYSAVKVDEDGENTSDAEKEVNVVIEEDRPKRPVKTPPVVKPKKTKKPFADRFRDLFRED